MKAIIIDNREPEWVKALTFGGALVGHEIMEYGDFLILADDDTMVVVERKTPGDLASTLMGERLFQQMAGLAALRKTEGYWPYLMITGTIQPGANGKACFDGKQTNMDYRSIVGALMSVQELGVMITWAAGDTDLEPALMSLAKRKHDTMLIEPVREGKVMGLAAGFLSGLPGIGPERAQSLIKQCTTAAWALVCLTGNTELEGIGPVGSGIRNNIRHVLGLQNTQQMGIITDDQLNEIMTILPMGQQ